MKLKKSLALRLTIIFILLTFIPLVILSFLLHLTITNTFYFLGTHYLREQAQTIATSLSGSDRLISQESIISKSDQDGHYAFVINKEGVYVAHPDASRVGRNIISDFGEGNFETIISKQAGDGRNEKAGIVFGYALIPGTDLTVVSIGNLEDIHSPLVEIEKLTFFQLLASIALTGLIASLVIWWVVGKPLKKLTIVADQLGEGNLEVNINPNEMKDELYQLAKSLVKMRDQLGDLIRGLQTRINELAQAQNSIKLSDEHSRAIFDAVNEAILVLDMDTGEIIDVNKKMTEMYGYSREEALGLKISVLSLGELPYTHKYYKKYMKEAVQSGPQLFEWRAKHKDGSLFWIEVNMRQAVVAGRNRILVAVREINERKRAEQVRTAIYRISHSVPAAQNLNELFYLIHGIINDLMPAQNFYIALYDQYRDQFYYPYYVDQFDTTPAPHTPNRGLTSYVLRTGSTLLATPEVFEQLLKSGDVQMIGANSVDWLGAPLNSAQRVIGVIAVQTYTKRERLTDEDKDVLSFVSTQIAMAIERKRSEDALLESETRWRTLTENAPQYILLLDRSGNILFGNRFLPGMGLDDPGGRSFIHFAQDENRLKIEKALDQVFIESKGVNFEIVIQDNTHALAWYACNLAPVINEKRVEMAILNASDISERKDAEKAIRTLNEELEKRVLERTTQLASVVRELESFSYSVSHDLRAPLRALDGYSRILEKEYQPLLNEDGKNYIRFIRTSTQQMGHLIDDLLAFARLGRHPLEKQNVDMRNLVRQTVDEFIHERDERDVDIQIADLPTCEGDPSLLHQVWVNLISNSLKFTRNCAHVQIEIGFQEEHDLVYYIKDNGTGFDMKYADKLFGVFQRLHRPDEFEGTGVGLAIVERIIRRHGGQIWAESALGEGATFYFTINGSSDMESETEPGV